MSSETAEGATVRVRPTRTALALGLTMRVGPAVLFAAIGADQFQTMNRPVGAVLVAAALLLVASGLRFATSSAVLGTRTVSISRLVGRRSIPVDRVVVATSARVVPPFGLPCVAVQSGDSIYKLPWTTCSSVAGSDRVGRADAGRVVGAVTAWGAVTGVDVAVTAEQLTGDAPLK